MILLKIAWRNVWRNKLRSSVVILAIIMGITAGVFAVAFSMGMNNQRTETMLKSMISHIQIHDSLYLEEQELSRTMNPDSIGEVLEKEAAVKSWTERLVITGMAGSAKTNSGVMIQAIHPEMEKQVTDLYEKLQEGNYLNEGSNPVLIGRKLADKLDLKLKSKMVLTFQDIDGNLVQERFKVCGIFKSMSSTYDERALFIRMEDGQRLFKANGEIHEVAIWLGNQERARPLAKKLQKALPEYKVRPWQEASPELGYADETMAMSLNIFMGIIMLALIGSIINTMLMAVLERKRELGMILCVGMNKTKVFLMILYETVFLAAVGGPIGILAAYAIVAYYGNVGIPLSGLEQGMEAFGLGTVVYPEIDSTYLLNIAVMVIITSIIAAIIPGRRAIRLKPAEAVRAI